MEIQTFIEDLKNQNIELILAGDKIDIAFEGELSEKTLNNIKARKPEIVDFLRGNRVKGDDTNELLTPFQKGLVSYVKNNPESRRYIIQYAFQLNEELPFPHFMETCRILTSRFEILRTSFDFDTTTGNFITKILSDKDLQCQEFDLSSDSKYELNTLLDSIKKEGFDISGKPLIKFALIKQGKSKTTMVITVHHLVMDGNSVSILFREMLDISISLRNGTPPATEIPKRLQFSSYVNWINSQNKSEALKYWNKTLKDFSPALLESQTVGENKLSAGGYSELALNYTINTSSKEFLGSQGVSLSSAFNFLTGFVLSKFSGTGSFVWGNMVTLRPPDISESESILGPCISTIPVAMDFSEKKPVIDLVKQVQSQVSESRQYSHLSLNEIFNAAKVPNLFSVLFSYQHFELPESVAPAKSPEHKVNVEIEESRQLISSHFPVTLMFSHQGDNLYIKAGYKNELFSDFVIKDMMEAIIRLYNNIQAEAFRDAEAIDVFSERNTQLSSIISGEITDTPHKNSSLISSFAEAVKKYPERIAVKDIKGEPYSYEQINNMSDYIASEVLKFGSGKPVGIRLNRSVKMVASIIGVLKAGCHIVSLEPEFPEEKLKWLHSELNFGTLITEPHDSLIGKLNGVEEILLPKEIPGTKISISLPELNGNDICTYNYTSGSTGNPKMVYVSHLSHLNRIKWLESRLPAQTDDVYCFKTLLSFGPTIREIFEPLVQGATLYVFPEYANKDIEQFASVVNKFGITRMFLTPTFLQLLIDNDKISCLENLKYVEVSGEPAKMELIELLQKELPSVKFLNRYGATESASVVYNDEFNLISPKQRSMFFPLGKPIYNTKIYVVDENMKVRPRGFAGEILIESLSLSGGYNKKELEEGVFIKNFNKNAITLRTGDLGYVNDRGQLCYQGRRTRMIKVRGFRVEPAEIEYNMECHPEIKKAVVVPFETKFSYRINAFVVDNEMSQEAFNALNLKAFLSGRLPHYMQPHEIKLIDRMPLTQSGKVDFMALNAQLQKEMESIEYVTPETVTEKILHKILASLLPDVRIDAVTNFFDLGVDSILSLKATYEIKKKIGVKISGPQIYEYDNIQKMAAYIDKIMASEDEEHGDYYRLNHQEDNTEIIFLIPPLDVSSLIYVFLKPYVPEYLTVVVFDAFDLDKTEYTASMEKMASYYTERILKMGKDKNIHLCGWSFGATVTYEVAIQVQQAGKKVHSLTLVDPGFYASEYDDRVTKKDLVDIMNKLLIQGGINPEMEIDISDKMFEANRLVKHYRPGPYYGDILLIKPELVSDFERNYGKKYNGMEDFVKGNITLGKRIPGNHMTMMKGSIPYLSVAIFDNVRKNCEHLKEA